MKVKLFKTREDVSDKLPEKIEKILKLLEIQHKQEQKANNGEL